MIALAGNPKDTNTLSQPRNIEPVTTTLRGMKPVFTYTLTTQSIVAVKLSPH